jgi:hypothetical protein
MEDFFPQFIPKMNIIPKNIPSETQEKHPLRIHSRSFIPLKLISQYLFYTCLSPYRVSTPNKNGELLIKTYLLQKVHYISLYFIFISKTQRCLIVLLAGTSGIRSWICNSTIDNGSGGSYCQSYTR